MKIYIIAGEPSGDLHASNLMRSILDKHTNVDFRFWGGDRMKSIQKNGLVKHISELSFMGFIEVILNLNKILRNFKFCKDDIRCYNPDAIILIDYPGFNLRIAKWAKLMGIKVYYYISPQVWAWKKNRVYQIKKNVDCMFVILPFEKDFFESFDFQVQYFGHPLLDEISKFNSSNNHNFFMNSNNLGDLPIIAVLPGSRRQEISLLLPEMLKGLEVFRSHQIIVAGVSNLSLDFYKSIDPDINVVFNKTYDLLSNASIAVVTSGTATLETALFKVPQIVCYKSSLISYYIAKMLIKVNFISLVNLIMHKEVVKELIQKDCNSYTIQKEARKIIHDLHYQNEIKNNYQELEKKLGEVGASEKVAQFLLKDLLINS
ncbi:MAG: lipid-A-disaccharide synthase [Crocinitomicaceae bacterium]|nr:lipid-A-disaccharide synthase [Crocinitomicaceae bacterium]